MKKTFLIPLLTTLSAVFVLGNIVYSVVPEGLAVMNISSAEVPEGIAVMNISSAVVPEGIAPVNRSLAVVPERSAARNNDYPPANEGYSQALKNPPRDKKRIFIF